MTNLSELRVTIDALFAQAKTLAGHADWTPGYKGEGKRWLSPLAVDGVTTDMKLCVDYYPHSHELRFSITLVYETAVARLDFWSLDKHLNHPVKGVKMPSHISTGWITGSHIHSWQDNRALVVSNSPPKELEFAYKIPQNIHSFNAAFRYFCDMTGVVVAESEMPNPPKRDTLL